MAVPGGLLRAQAYSALSRFATQGYSFRAAARMARSLGYKFRTQWGLNVYNQAALYRQFRDPVLAISSNKVIPRHLIGEVDLRRARLYYVRGLARWYDPTTGEVFEEWGSFYTDRWSTGDDMAWEWDQARRRAQYREHLELQGFTITQALHNRGLPW